MPGLCGVGMSLLAAEGLVVRFGGAEVLSNVSLRLGPGEIVT
ncbi:MAG: ABC-type branched-subunit amino acid transport system ATPase component, partial [Pseudorhodobacter sp.]